MIVLCVWFALLTTRMSMKDDWWTARQLATKLWSLVHLCTDVCFDKCVSMVSWPEPHWLLAWIAIAHSHRRSAILSLTTCLQLQSISHCQDLGWPNLTAYINLCVTAWHIPLCSTLPSCQLCKYCHLQPLNRNATVDPQHLGYSGSKSSVITMQNKIKYDYDGFIYSSAWRPLSFTFIIVQFWKQSYEQHWMGNECTSVKICTVCCRTNTTNYAFIDTQCSFLVMMGMQVCTYYLLCTKQFKTCKEKYWNTVEW